VTCTFEHDDGPYVLGALSSADRKAFEEHLATCDECARSVRELAGLPGLLARVDPAVLEQPSPAETLPDTLLPRLLREVRVARRRRAVLTGSVAAAVLVVAGAVPAVVLAQRGDTPAASRPPAASTTAPTSRPPAVPTRAMVPLGGAPVRATLALEPVAWGTRLDLACTYAPRADQSGFPEVAVYVLVVRTRDGRTEQVGTWRTAQGRTMRLTAATSARRGQITSVEVRTTDGHRVLELTA
jgi:Putative zinc-finger